MKPDAQEKVWRAKRREIAALPGGKVHKLIRSTYSPKSHPELYTSPEKTLEKLQRKAAGRKARRRPRLSRDEKELLAKDLDLKEVELADGRDELQRLKREITLATQPIRGILRSKTLKELIPAETLEELERFAEVYC